MKLAAVCFFFALLISASADNLDTLGVTLLRQIDPTLNGSGVRVAQPEGLDIFTPNSAFPFEVNPGPVGQPASLFTWISSSNTAATTFPNTAGTESWHAASVGENFYGIPYGVATNVSHVDNYEADYFFNNKIFSGTSIPAAVVNQSFNFDPSGQAIVDAAYDDYVVLRKTIFVTGAGNGGSIVSNPPATSFNGITVGVYGASSSYGPTSDGRSKPDLTAPSTVTSFSSPYVSGAAAVLLQAAKRGDGGGGTLVPTNVISIKALLLNGAVKPADWTNGATRPLDARYGAGVLNVFNSWNQLKGGRCRAIETTTVGSGLAHPPGANTGNEASLTGWDYTNSFSTPSSQDKINHYYFNLAGSNAYTLTATLVWNLQQAKTNVNNLDLFLYDTRNGNLALSSTSAVDNVEHLFLPQLAPGRYDLQVMKRGSGQVAASETYAFAVEFFSMQLKIALTNGNAILSWTNAPTGFRLVSTTSLNPSVSWATVNATVSMTNNQNIVVVPVTGTSQFFCLQRP